MFREPGNSTPRSELNTEQNCFKKIFLNATFLLTKTAKFMKIYFRIVYFTMPCLSKNRFLVSVCRAVKLIAK